MVEDEPRIIDNPEEMRYELLLGDRRAGFLAYRRESDVVALTHTEIDPALRGRGLGSRLAAEVLDELRRRGLKPVPLCPFIADHLHRNPERRDILP